MESDAKSESGARKPKRSPPSLRPFALLAGREQPSYRYEPALRLWQVKIWLTSSRSRRRSFKLSARMLANHVVQSELAARSGSTWARLKAAMQDPDIRSLFNDVFKRVELLTNDKDDVVSLYGSLRARSGPERQKHMEYWIEQARVRAALQRQFEFAPLYNAELYMENKKKEDPEYDKRVFGSQLGERVTLFKAKSVFMCAARDVCPSLLSFEYDADALMEQLLNEVPPPEQFEAFCARSKSLHELLGLTGANFLDRALGPLPASLPHYEPFAEKWELKFKRPLRHNN